MTKEEAIAEIRDTFTDEWANEMIQALEKEPCEDCVSRKEVLKVFSYNHDYCDDYETAFLKSIGDTRKLPSVQPTRIHAKWIEHPHEKGWVGFSAYECSNCHSYSKNDSDFCPNCGAKMESEVNNGNDD